MQARTLSAEEVAGTLVPTRSSTEAPQARVPTGETPTAAFERYVTVRELGRGGMGRVDEVQDVVLGRAVARKTTLADAHEGRIRALVGEAQTCAQLEHPSIVPVYDLGVGPDGAPYYTMRAVRGKTLRDVLAASGDAAPGRRALVPLLSILRQICLAADYAHGRGVVHRDLKPENVIVGEFGEVYILDWGIAQLTGASSVRRQEQKGYAAGSPGYMAPEQAVSGEVDARADVFALGAMLYEVLTGEVPFADRDVMSIVRRALTRLETPPSQRSPTLGPTFDAIVTACLEPRRQDRPASARAIVEAIDAYLDDEQKRAERERDAEQHTGEGEAALAEFVERAAESRRLLREAELELAAVPRFEGVGAKASAWQKASAARSLASDAARSLARAEAGFTRALGRVERYARARRGLAQLYFRQFEDAERAGQPERMAQYLDLAREYDDGELELELADEGELCVRTPDAATATLARYEPSGPLLVLGEPRPLSASPDAVSRLASGSYLVTVTDGARATRHPVLIERAHRHTLRPRAPAALPEDLVLVPGGPFRTHTREQRELPDFAIGRFPVTVAEYGQFLDALEPPERDARTPRPSSADSPGLVRGQAGWTIASDWIEGEAARARVADREHALPVVCISWHDAVAYCHWLATTTGLPYRLPTVLEWEKAARGADGRPFPMGTELDPSFAKLRGSRPEAAQSEPVGAFPHDESPYGVRDLAGGVGEWTATQVSGPALAGAHEDETGEAYWCGGTWSSTGPDARPLYTQMLRHRVPWVGFRVALSLPGPSSELVVEPMKRG